MGLAEPGPAVAFVRDFDHDLRQWYGKPAHIAQSGRIAHPAQHKYSSADQHKLSAPLRHTSAHATGQADRPALRPRP